MIPIKPVGMQNPKSATRAAITEAAQQRTDDPALAYLRPGALNLPVLPPLALYVHIPWCLRKCPYCDFNSHAVDRLPNEEVPEQAYLAALQIDLEEALPLIWGRRIVSVFIGGGTPSLFSAQAMDQLMSMLRTLLPLDSLAEITLEANPGTFEVDKFRAYRDAGINRLSIGIQSFNPQHLQALGRVHDDRQARFAVEVAQQTFERFNLDLMVALPEQSLQQLQQDVHTALSFQPPHLSLYHLTLEPNTLFYRHPPALPDDDAAAEMQEWINATMAQQGYENYEVSAYARPGFQCQHNLNYWQFGDYLGIGAGAHSKLSFPHRVLRQMRYKQPKAYMEAAQQRRPVQEQHEVTPQDLPFEFMLNLLRLRDGGSVNLFAERTGLMLNQIEPQLLEAERKGLLYRDHVVLRPTELGLRFLNDLQAMFLAGQ
jgi:oxygen-independent coproporphyrinogen-3 oxidase